MHPTKGLARTTTVVTPARPQSSINHIDFSDVMLLLVLVIQKKTWPAAEDTFQRQALTRLALKLM
jgi:hypothetical protein